MSTLEGKKYLVMIMTKAMLFFLGGGGGRRNSKHVAQAASVHTGHFS